MQKKIIIYFFLSSLLLAREPVMAILENVISNEQQQFKVNNFRFICTPYGIFTLEELYRNAQNNGRCQRLIYDFYEKNIEAQYYAQKKLSVMQSYSIVIKNKKCVINIDGEKSYSEFLLEEGLAIKKPVRLDREYDYIFYKSQREAKASRIGLWNLNISKACMSSIFIKK